MIWRNDARHKIRPWNEKDVTEHKFENVASIRTVNPQWLWTRYQQNNHMWRDHCIGIISLNQQFIQQSRSIVLHDDVVTLEPSSVQLRGDVSFSNTIRWSQHSDACRLVFEVLSSDAAIADVNREIWADCWKKFGLVPTPRKGTFVWKN